MHATRKRKPATDEWMTMRAAAIALGTTRYSLQRRALHGEFTTTLVAGRTVVSRADVDAALAAEAAAVSTTADAA